MKTVNFKLSIRQVPYFSLPGEDKESHTRALGASIRGKSILRGLSIEEEERYLPEIIGVSPKDPNWYNMTREYWCNISVKVPADGSTVDKYQGKVLEFTLKFDSNKDAEDFEKVLDFEAKAEASKKGIVIDGLADYILFRFAIVSGRVANNYKDIRKSPKIDFYLYSPQIETKAKHLEFKARAEARSKFIEILDDESLINSLLLIFNQDLSLFETIQDKHLVLESLIENSPAKFLEEVKDADIKIKASIKKAVDNGILYKPANTDTYYYGENKEVCLGHTLKDAVLYLKSDIESNQEIKKAISARLKQIS